MTSVTLIETMAFTPAGGVARVDRHMARLRASAAALGLACDESAVRAALGLALAAACEPLRVRLTLFEGEASVTLSPMPLVPVLADVVVMPLPVATDDIRLRHKTTDRAFYDNARAASGAFEVVFTDPDGWLTEGSFTNLFVARHGVLLTPPLSRGLLPGVLRADLIDGGRAVEADLRVTDLADGLLIGNALRGLMPAVLVE
ncbi:aminotransferase class IV [Sphingomonas sp. RS2018]